MKFIQSLILLLIVPLFSNAQDDFLIIQTTDTFVVYHIQFSPQLSNDDKTVSVYHDHPGQIARESAMYKGKRSGIEKTYYPSGKLYQTFVYADDKLWGEYRQFAEDGKQVVRGNFINDLEHGLWIDEISGCTGRYKNGQKQGRWRCNEGEIPYKLYVFRKGEMKRKK